MYIYVLYFFYKKMNVWAINSDTFPIFCQISLNIAIFYTITHIILYLSTYTLLYSLPHVSYNDCIEL